MSPNSFGIGDELIATGLPKYVIGCAQPPNVPCFQRSTYLSL